MRPQITRQTSFWTDFNYLYFRNRPCATRIPLSSGTTLLQHISCIRYESQSTYVWEHGKCLINNFVSHAGININQNSTIYGIGTNIFNIETTHRSNQIQNTKRHVSRYCTWLTGVTISTTLLCGLIQKSSAITAFSYNIILYHF